MDEIKRKRDVERVAEGIKACVVRFFSEPHVGDSDAKLLVEPEDTGAYRDGRGVEIYVHFHVPNNGDSIDVRMVVDNNYGGNVYFTDVSVDGGEVQRCPVTVPDPLLSGDSIRPDDLQIFVEDLCNHILTEIKLVVGERELRKTAGTT